jgi:hypothetical protein
VLARQAVFLFLRHRETLSDEEQETLTQLRLLHSEVDQVYDLVQQFARMLRTRTENSLTTGSHAYAKVKFAPRVCSEC